MATTRQTMASSLTDDHLQEILLELMDNEWDGKPLNETGPFYSFARRYGPLTSSLSLHLTMARQACYYEAASRWIGGM